MKNLFNFFKDYELIDIVLIIEKYMLLFVYCKKNVYIDYLFICIYIMFMNYVEVINYIKLYLEKYMLLYILIK